MPKYKLSPQAQHSLKQISRYTVENFGERQKKKYLKMLRDKMGAAAKTPDKGRDRSDIKPSYFSVSAGKHTIYYRIHSTHIDIIDVLHQSMEPTLYI
jgi:toxin ParE1/3/4